MADEEVMDVELNDAPDTEVVEQSEAEITETPTEEIPSETPEAEKPEGEQPDARTLPKEVQKALKALRENPETAKIARELNDSYFRERAYQKHGSVAQVAAMASTLTRLGGEEGVATLENEVSEYASELSQFTEGNKAVLDKWVTQAPEGFKKLAPHILGKLYDLDKGVYGQAVAPVIAGTLQNYGLDQRALEALSNSTDPNAKAIGQQLSQLFNELKETLRNVPKQNDEEQTKISKEWEEIYSERQAGQIREVGSQTLAYQNRKMEQQIAPLLKNRPLSDDAKSDLRSGISGEVEKMLSSDKVYQSHVKAAIDKLKGDVKAKKDVSEQKRTLSSYINAKMDELVPKAVRAVWNRRYGSMPAQKTNGNGKQASTPAGKLAHAPKLAELDKVKDYQLLYMANKGFIKGRAVSW